MKSDISYLRHILEAVDSIEEYLEGKCYEEFVPNKMLQDAVIRELEIIGEASNNLSAAFREKHSSLL